MDSFHSGSVESCDVYYDVQNLWPKKHTISLRMSERDAAVSLSTSVGLGAYLFPSRCCDFSLENRSGRRLVQGRMSALGRIHLNLMLSVLLWSVEEVECKRAYDTAAEVYVSSFDRTKTPEEDKYEYAMASLAAMEKRPPCSISPAKLKHKLLQGVQNLSTRHCEAHQTRVHVRFEQFSVEDESMLEVAE